MSDTISIEELFAGHDDVLAVVVGKSMAGERASKIADEHLVPIIEDLNRNAGQEMDPTYIAFMIEAIYRGMASPSELN